MAIAQERTRTGSTVDLDHGRIVGGLALAIVAVDMAYVLSLVWDSPLLKSWLLLGLERNPSTWLASALLAMAATAAWTVGRTRHDRARWTLVAGLLMVMSVDEIARFHERLGLLPGLPHIGQRAWLVAGLLIVLAVAVVLVPWALQLERPLRRTLLAGGATFVAGALAFEAVAAEWSARHGYEGVYWLIEGIEENLEFLGVLIVVHGLLAHLKRTGSLSISVS